MNDITVATKEVTMTSLELVEFINVQRNEDEAELRHDHFMAKVPQVLGEIGAGNFSCTYRDVQNKERPCYTFPKREACLMAMSYSYEIQAKVFDRMTKLEAGAPKLPDLNNPAVLRGLLDNYAERVITLENVIADQAPTVEAFDRLSKTEGLTNITNAAKMMQVQPKVLFRFLSAMKWIYKRDGMGSWIGYQDKIQIGLLEMKAHNYTNSHGDDCQSPQVYLTSKGMTRIAKEFSATPEFLK